MWQTVICTGLALLWDVRVGKAGKCGKALTWGISAERAFPPPSSLPVFGSRLILIKPSGAEPPARGPIAGEYKVGGSRFNHQPSLPKR